MGGLPISAPVSLSGLPVCERLSQQRLRPASVCGGLIESVPSRGCDSAAFLVLRT
jgi:hypothetical protein